MNNVVLQMLEDYDCKTSTEYENALKEIMQEIALLGLWRSKFYEHALFYGGTALRILYQLPRFSEDLDFSLIKTKNDFDLTPYLDGIKMELEAFGFIVEIQKKKKTEESQVESAFIKAFTKTHLMKISAPFEISHQLQSNQMLKIKVELDTNPPQGFETEVIDVFRPIPFQVKTMPLTDLFSGKLHAVLARKWKSRAKGRDFYDYFWYLGRGISVNLNHLQSRLIQSGHLNETSILTQIECQSMLKDRFSVLDIEQAKSDVEPFLNPREKQSLSLWSRDYFIKSVDRLKFFSPTNSVPK
jgi:predicted nucleotidyltransferase component of viral defense system